MSKKTLLIIAAVAVMLVGATSAYGYYEHWNGWFNSGYLKYLGATFDYTTGSGVLEDRTFGDVDSFFVNAVDVSTFTCESGEFAGYYIMLYPDASGWKYTGQRGHKEAHNGGWTAQAFLHIPSTPPQTVEFTAEGTWDTGTSHDGYYFNYYPATPTYSAKWYFVGSTLPGLQEGKGGCEGDRVLYED
ncbi:hypothetical protein CEE36_10615 [candidate division TA06 bacterium B3_TA06]|uniref:Uncharacterized protein n=1 Tax=candidate division TA06 bacterium B3_TA06 TaxID=2012487 RepID=A0A532UUN9_UNCT6|nr:MAG: hypothetical protein CEE36_10615 [candidate division TA06 bacterium B3_TA06]